MGAPAFKKTLQMGLGEAIKRLNMIHAKITGGVATPEDRKEHELILEALNVTKLDLGFDCNMDGVPDSIQIFAESAKTSCCRIMPVESPRRKSAPRKRTTTTRRKK